MVKVLSMTDKMKISLAQLNPVLGDIPGNAKLIREARAIYESIFPAAAPVSEGRDSSE